MTDTPASRLWPLALMGWLAAIPPLTEPNAAGAVPRPWMERAEAGERTAWLGAARARYAALSDEERTQLRQERRARRAAGAA